MKKVLVALSGGVDSATSAYLLKKQGYEVAGATLVLHDISCEIPAAKKICDTLNIKHYSFEFKKEFSNIVIKNFIENYSNAKTPNPCVICNETIKFGLLLQKAKELGFDFMATGHYSNIVSISGTYYLQKPKDVQKDQTYVLYRLNQQQLSKVLFPLANYTKAQVRQIAKEANLPCADRQESQENCFIEGAYTDFLLANLPKGSVKPGDIYDMSGKKLGKHKGLIYYTIGQRSGLGLTTANPVYVIKMDIKNNALIVGTKEETFSKEMKIENVVWTKPQKFPFKAEVKIRRMHKPALATINENFIVFDEPQGAITPGQSAVIYLNDVVIGGGIIE